MMTRNDPAVVWGTRRISWRQLDELCSSVIGQLKGLGIKAGDRVAIASVPCTEYIIVLFALWRIKVVVCPISPRWPVASVNDYLSRISAALLLTSAPIKQQWPGIHVRTLLLNEVVCFDARRGLGKAEEPFAPTMDQEATIIATSGSSGTPKAAVHTWGNHFYNAQGAAAVIPVTAGDRWALSLPLYHVSGLGIVMRCFLAGAAIVIQTEDNLAETITRRQVTHISLVPAQVYRLLQTPEGIAALKSLKYILLGGSAVPASLIDQCKAHGLNAYVSYGLTEMASQVATGKAGGCIKVLPHRELMVDDGGEVWVKGDTLFKGYFQAGRVHLPLSSQGWFQTGDMGTLDAEGCLSISGRRDNMFISGGENIHPEEIEKVLLSLPGVTEAIVVGRQDNTYGHRPVAFIKHSPSLTAEAIAVHCRKHLPDFKVPVKFYPWPDELMNTALKISRQDFVKRV